MSPRDFTQRIFVDTNILIDGTITPDQRAIDFLTLAGQNSSIELVTSDYVMWEKIDFVRMQNWVANAIAKGKSYKDGITGKIEITGELVTKISSDLANYSTTIEDKFNVENFNIMDSPTKKSTFFEALKKLMYCSAISKQDLLVLLSAHDLGCHAILTKDKQFDLDLNRARQFESDLQQALIPGELKDLKFYRDLNKTPQQYYNDWFTEKIIPQAIFKITDGIYQHPNVAEIDTELSNPIAIGDYLYFLKTSDEGTHVWHTKVEPGMLRDYDTKDDIQQGNHVTLKLPESIPVGDIRNTYVFKVE